MKTLAELKQMNFIPHHDCACCGVFVGWYVNEHNPWFDPTCDCGSGGGHYDTWEKVFKYYNSVFEKESVKDVNTAWESAKAPKADDAIADLEVRLSAIQSDKMQLEDENRELRKENEDLKNELLDAKRDACRFEKAMYRALFNWAHVRTFVYMKEHGMLPLSITPDNLNVPYQWRNALNLCKLNYDFAKAAQDELPKKTKAPEVK